MLSRSPHHVSCDQRHQVVAMSPLFGAGAVPIAGYRSERAFWFHEKTDARGLLAKSDPLLLTKVQFGQ